MRLYEFNDNILNERVSNKDIIFQKDFGNWELRVHQHLQDQLSRTDAQCEITQAGAMSIINQIGTVLHILVELIELGKWNQLYFRDINTGIEVGAQLVNIGGGKIKPQVTAMTVICKNSLRRHGKSPTIIINSGHKKVLLPI